jgi:hypothetical protein
LAEKLAEPRNRIRFGGGGVGSGYINPDLMKIPGPGAYFPENVPDKPHTIKPKPFGSTTKRFEDNPVFKEGIPAVGSYNLEEVPMY